MDELDLLKKDWNKPSERNKLSAKDIYPMLQKKSSSIVKTLFYISIAELAFWIVINFIPYFASEGYKAKLDSVYTNEYVFGTITTISYGIILLFIYLLYKAYRAISVTDSIKNLMRSIIKTRKIIKYYVLYNLVVAGVSLLIGFYYAFTHDPELTDKFAHFTTKQVVVTSMIVVVFTVVFILILWLFYRLIYGLLLKRLNKNYRELKKLEI
ncbi:hypothetical protein [Aestuariibaculum marinum]|uniref:Uncharacterized protein n=1 Tax=Aestuariibaculum marinum TaxID=2683592 RepID=A0A8J6UB10_9FLAO|nr:hypothetical protein [Aestuariibaculum marinum]MBD0825236.1 hypothetical protein [Aestuariibaculum marinum]